MEKEKIKEEMTGEEVIAAAVEEMRYLTLSDDSDVEEKTIKRF